MSVSSLSATHEYRAMEVIRKGKKPSNLGQEMYSFVMFVPVNVLDSKVLKS